MGATVVQYPTPTLVSGSLRTLSATPSAAASNSKISVPALSVTAVVRRYVPETTSSSTTALPATFDNIGWQMDTDIVPLSDAGVTRASTVTVRCAVQANQATGFTVSVALYIGTTRIGTQTNALVNLTTAQSNIDVPITVAAGQAIAAGARLSVAVSASCTNLSATTASTVTLLYTSTGSTVSALTYTINAVRNGTETPTATDSASRTSSTTRTTSEATTSTDAGTRVSSDFRRSTEAVESQADTVSRLANYPRTGAEATTTTDSDSRMTVDVRRTAGDSETEIDTAFRAITKSINLTDVAPTGTQSAQKTLTFGRGTREYFQPTDPPITVPTKRIAGTVYLRADGSRYLGGATVTLVRDSDGLECGTTTSSTVDGTYNFTRDAFDTNTYTTRIKHEVVGTQVEEAISQNGLVPT